MSTGTIVKWHKQEGDRLQPGDLLCEIQTDKAIMAFEFDEEGVLAKILVNENVADIPVGKLIAIVVDEGDDWKAVKVPAEEGVAAGSASVSSETVASSIKETIAVKVTKMAPSARNLVHHYDIKVDQLSATGPKGILQKTDVLKVSICISVNLNSLSFFPVAH